MFEVGIYIRDMLLWVYYDELFEPLKTVHQ